MKRLVYYIHRTFTFVEDWSLFVTVMVTLRKLTSDVNRNWSDEVVRKTIFFTTYVGSIAAIRNRSLIRIDAAGADFRRHLLRLLYCQRSRCGRLPGSALLILKS